MITRLLTPGERLYLAYRKRERKSKIFGGILKVFCILVFGNLLAAVVGGSIWGMKAVPPDWFLCTSFAVLMGSGFVLKYLRI